MRLIFAIILGLFTILGCGIGLRPIKILTPAVSPNTNPSYSQVLNQFVQQGPIQAAYAPVWFQLETYGCQMCHFVGSTYGIPSGATFADINPSVALGTTQYRFFNELTTYASNAHCLRTEVCNQLDTTALNQAQSHFLSIATSASSIPVAPEALATPSASTSPSASASSAVGNQNFSSVSALSTKAQQAYQSGLYRYVTTQLQCNLCHAKGKQQASLPFADSNTTVAFSVNSSVINQIPEKASNGHCGSQSICGNSQFQINAQNYLNQFNQAIIAP